MAERMNRKAQSANPPEMVADVDRTALLGIKPAERACGVDEGDEECECNTQLQQTNLHDEESYQCNKNAQEDIPSTYGLPLMGEWTVYASGEARDPRSSVNVPNATPECVHRPSKLREAEDAEGVESRGCESGTSQRASVDELETLVECCQQLCMASSDGDRGVEPADNPNKSEELVTVSIKSESPNGGEILRVCLGGTHWHAGDANRPGCGTEMLRGQADGWRGQTNTPSVSNSAETTGISHRDGAGTYLDARGAKHVIDATNGVANHTDMSSGYWDVQSVNTDAVSTENATQNVSTAPKPKKLPDLPGKDARWAPDEPNGFVNPADASSVHTDTHSVGNNIERWWSAQGRSSLKRREKEICSVTSVVWQATVILVYTCR